MECKERRFTLPTGEAVILRSPRWEDGPAVLDLLRRTSDETHFMAREGDEIRLTGAQEAEFLTQVLTHPRQFEFMAFVDGRPAGECGVHPVRETRKCLHRGDLGIAILRSYWGRGLGTAMVEACLEAAKEAGYRQVELGVYADNQRAIHTYEKLGFQAVGTIPGAYRLPDGTYRDEIQMVRILVDG